MVRLSSLSQEGERLEAPVIVYVSPDTESLYVSRQALVALRVISEDFPKIGGTPTDNNSAAGIETTLLDELPKCDKNAVSCKCPKRVKPPTRPERELDLLSAHQIHSRCRENV